jgi:hypothetical protein
VPFVGVTMHAETLLGGDATLVVVLSPLSERGRLAWSQVMRVSQPDCLGKLVLRHLGTTGDVLLAGLLQEFFLGEFFGLLVHADDVGLISP